MESKYTQYNGSVSPVDGETIVQLRLANGNEPIDKAEIFYWGKVGRGKDFPDIWGYREATQEEFDEYQERKANHRAELKNAD